MAAVTEDRLIERSEECRDGGPVATATTLYAGTLAFLNSGGYYDDDTATGANEFAGVVINRVDNSGGGNGALNCEVWTEGRFKLVGSGFAQSSVGKRVYAIDNYTLTLDGTTSGAVYIGKIKEYVSSTVVVVELDTERVPGTAIAAVNTGTINSGDATTDTVITSLKTRVTAILAELVAQGLLKP